MSTSSTKKLEIIKVNDQTVQTAADIKDIPFFHGKVLLNTNAAWKRDWDRHAVWISPCGGKVSNLTKEQYQQLIDAGVPVIDRPLNEEVNTLVSLLSKIAHHEDLIGYVEEKTGILLDLTEFDDALESAMMEKHDYHRVGKMNITQSKIGNSLHYTISTSITDGKVLIEIGISAYMHINKFRIITQDNAYYDFVEEDTNSDDIPFRKIEEELNLDFADVKVIATDLKYATHNTNDRNIFPETLRVWPDTFCGTYYISMQV